MLKSLRLIPKGQGQKPETTCSFGFETSHHFYCILLVLQANSSAKWEGTAQGGEHGETGTIGDHLGGCLRLWTM